MNPAICWPDSRLPIEIYCAPGILTGLEMVAADGLLAMPRIGLGVGGLLLGRRGNRRLEILKTVEITCSHALGPAFIMTPEEIRASSPANPEDDPDHELLGWYCSKPTFTKTPGPMSLTAHDQTLFDVLCPEPWQVVLLIRPSMGKATTAVFGFRPSGESGDRFLLGETRELAWQELAAFEDPPPVELIREPGPEPAEIPIAMPATGTLFGTSDTMPEARGPRRWPLRLALVVLVLAILAGTAFLTRGYWIPRPPIALVASSDWTGRVTVLWNSEALAGQDQVTLVIDDGAGPLHTIHLTPAEARAGVSEYHCRPGNVTVTLLAGDLSDTAATTVVK